MKCANANILISFIRNDIFLYLQLCKNCVKSLNYLAIRVTGHSVMVLKYLLLIELFVAVYACNRLLFMMN